MQAIGTAGVKGLMVVVQMVGVIVGELAGSGQWAAQLTDAGVRSNCGCGNENALGLGCGQGTDVETVTLMSGVVDGCVDELTMGVVNVVCDGELVGKERVVRECGRSPKLMPRWKLCEIHLYIYYSFSQLIAFVV